jgi:hypothetical protein|tara:strand:- start:425 stop:739 length:315 start_codon:yes stop_codon:yes gene_type:complete
VSTLGTLYLIASCDLSIPAHREQAKEVYAKGVPHRWDNRAVQHFQLFGGFQPDFNHREWKNFAIRDAYLHADHISGEGIRVTQPMFMDDARQRIVTPNSDEEAS